MKSQSILTSSGVTGKVLVQLLIHSQASTILDTLGQLLLEIRTSELSVSVVVAVSLVELDITLQLVCLSFQF